MSGRMYIYFGPDGNSGRFIQMVRKCPEVMRRAVWIDVRTAQRLPVSQVPAIMCNNNIVVGSQAFQYVAQFLAAAFVDDETHLKGGANQYGQGKDLTIAQSDIFGPAR